MAAAGAVAPGEVEAALAAADFREGVLEEEEDADYKSSHFTCKQRHKWLK